MRRFNLRMFLALTPLLILTALAGCSGKPPELRTVSYQLNLFKPDAAEPEGGHAPFEKLSVFAQVVDEDGIKNLDTLYVIEDGAGLFWKLTPAGWVEREQGGDTWIGTNGIRMADFSPLPRGKYRLLITDKGGERVEREFMLTSGVPDPARLPRLSVSAGEISIRSAFEKTVLYVLDRSENSFKTIPVNPGTYTLSSVITGGEVSRTYSFLLSAYDRERNVGLIVERRFTPPVAAPAMPTPGAPGPARSGGTIPDGSPPGSVPAASAQP